MSSLTHFASLPSRISSTASSASLLIVMLAAPLARGQGGAPDQTLLAERGKESLAKLDSEIFSWTAVHTSPQMPPVRVDTLHLPEMQRLTVSVQTGESARLLARIYVRDGYWYVQQGDVTAKYRPYEAPFEDPILYMYLAQSQLRRVEANEPLGKFEGVEDHLALYRVLPTADEASRLAQTGKGLEKSLQEFRSQRAKANQAFRAALARLQKKGNKNQGDGDASDEGDGGGGGGGGGGGKGKGRGGKGAVNMNEIRQAMQAHQQLEEQRDKIEAAMQQRIKRVADRRKSGVIVKVDGRSGVFMQWGVENQVVIRNLQRHDPREIDPTWFDVDLQSWLDMAAERTEADYLELAMFNHNARWRPDGPRLTATAVLADLAGGPILRVPYRGGIAVGGCFSADRRKVYVLGQRLTKPAVDLFEIDLATGVNRRLGGEALADGFVDAPSLSMDGKRLVVLHKPSLLKPEAQVYLVDIAGGEAKPVGEPLRASSPSWLPNDEGIVLAIEDASGASTIQRLDFDGKLTVLQYGGRSPTVLLPRHLILYDAGQAGSHSWTICDIDGRRAQPVGDGMADFAAAAPSAIGTKALMLKLGGEQGPRPHVVDLENGDTRELSFGLGSWSHPVWK